MERFSDKIHLFFFNLCAESSTMHTQAGTLSASSKEIINTNFPLENRENQLLKIDISEVFTKEKFFLESSLHQISYFLQISRNARLY